MKPLGLPTALLLLLLLLWANTLVASVFVRVCMDSEWRFIIYACADEVKEIVRGGKDKTPGPTVRLRVRGERVLPFFFPNEPGSDFSSARLCFLLWE